MQRSSSLLTGIALGAVAAGFGVGIFLYKANQDRIRLADQAHMTLEEITKIREENRRTIEETNNRLEIAKNQVTKAQETVRTLEEERDFLTRAIPLLPPNPRELYGWSELVALRQGFTLKVPPRLKNTTNNEEEFSVAEESTSQNSFPWLFISPYDEKHEQDLLANVVTSTPISYLVHDHLLTGVRGITRNSQSPIYILHIQKNGKITHLLWIQPPSVAYAGEKTLLTVLSTLRFQ